MKVNGRHCGSRADASESEEYPTDLHIKVKKDTPMKVAKQLLGSICLETGRKSGKTHGGIQSAHSDGDLLHVLV